MAELHPTKTRLRLLQAVADGAVKWHRRAWDGENEWKLDCIGAGWGDSSGRWLRVTARVEEQITVGWVRKGNPTHPGYYAPRLAEITPAGQAVLEQHGGSHVG